MPLQVVQIANKSIQFNELLLADTLELATKNPKHFEAQLSIILNRIVGSEVVPTLSVQERYAMFLKYLSIVPCHDLDESIDIQEFLNEDLNTIHLKPISNNEGLSVRPLMGIEAEVLEQVCNGTEDWILGELALTIEYENLPAIPIGPGAPKLSPKYISNILENRINILKNLSITEFNQLMNKFLVLRNKVNTLVNFTFDNGIVLEKINGGTDDAPVRFRPTTAIFGYSKELLSISNQAHSGI